MKIATPSTSPSGDRVLQPSRSPDTLRDVTTNGASPSPREEMSRGREPAAPEVQQKRKRGRPKGSGLRNGLTAEEIMSLVCLYLCKGLSLADIAKVLKREHQVPMTRQEPYEIIQQAARRGRLCYSPPLESDLQLKISARHSGWLRGMEVVNTSTAYHVALQGARTLLNLVRERVAANKSPDVPVRIGWAGGHTMRKVAKEFSELLRRPVDGLPRKIVFHGAVAAFDTAHPFNDTNGFFTYFAKDSAMRVEPEFMCLPAPVVVEKEVLSAIQKCKGIREAREAAKDLDILVTSGSCWNDPHSMYRYYMVDSDEIRKRLEAAGIVGDIMLLPVGADGPLEADAAQLRAVTLFEDLSALEKFVDGGMAVLLVLGPCGNCGTLKTELLKAVLDMRQHLISHLVVDSRAASEYLSGKSA